MKRPSNNSLALLMIALMLSSLIGTTLISYMANKKVSVSGEISTEQTGIVGVEVVSSTTPSSESSSSAGGGGGGRAGPKTYIIDFRIKEVYSITVGKDDTIIVIFSDEDKYILKVKKFIDNKIATLSIDETSFNVLSDEITSVDFDRDNLVDMTINIDDTKLTFSLFHKPKNPEKVKPIISSQKIGKEEGLEKSIIPKERYAYLIILIIIMLIVLSLVLYQHFRLRNVEKVQKKKLGNLSKEYSKKTKDTQDRKAMKLKLEKQLEILDNSYQSKFISQDSYIKGKRRIKDMIDKL